MRFHVSGQPYRVCAGGADDMDILKPITRRGFIQGAAAAVFSACGLSTRARTNKKISHQTQPTKNDIAAGRIDKVSLRILWTGDIHGQVRPIYHREPLGREFLRNNRIEVGSAESYLSSHIDFLELANKHGKVGGLAHVAALIRNERARYPERTILLDSGDAWYGSAIAMLTEGRACVDIMNAIGYDAMTMHWELNLGKKALLDRIAEANFAVLAQNLVDTEFEDRVLQSSLIRDIDGLRVAIVGEAYPFSLLTTEDPALNPGWRMGYRDVELQAEVNRVQEEEGAQLVVLLSHMGLPQDLAMAERLEGVDVIVGGHTHGILWTPLQVGETLIVQAGSHGKFLGVLDIEVSDGRMVGYQHKLLPVLSERVEPDNQINELIDNLYLPYQNDLERVIGETQSTLYRHSLFGGTTDAFVTSAYREIAGTDLSCVGGWRFGATLLPGLVTVEDVYNVMKPTPSPLYTAQLTGLDVRNIIEDNLDNVFNPDPMLRLGGDMNRCSGIKANLHKEGTHGNRLMDPIVNGTPLADDHVYTLATSGGRTQRVDNNPVATDLPAVEELINYIESNPPIVINHPVQTYNDTG